MRCQSPCADDVEVGVCRHTLFADADSDPGIAESLLGMASWAATLLIAQPA
jgi:hypothetical protein